VNSLALQALRTVPGVSNENIFRIAEKCGNLADLAKLGSITEISEKLFGEKKDLVAAQKIFSFFSSQNNESSTGNTESSENNIVECGSSELQSAEKG